ncbi:uncharacterized protein TNIN_288601 [Trichonephila inaurata madagascariensis]|uniref:Uncharacterized protein n=1 Tax=Trichonephila inaurata madagascariensis TaxID=2747483 RepID=A0A8X6YQ63_9ARAC|nr:uncharacterized protein TNIN_288601 [Trichonephila inaurata madagascariensis]
MTSETSPVAAGFAIVLVFLFLILLVTWCCRQFNRTKETSITLLPPQHRYVSTIDVQTGLPVIVDVSTLTNSRSQTRILADRRSSSCPINTHNNSTLYGTISHTPSSANYYDILPRTPPPPYSEVLAQQQQQQQQEA